MSKLFDKHPPKTIKEAAGLSHTANRLVSRIHARLMTAKWFDTPERLARLGIVVKKSGESKPKTINSSSQNAGLLRVEKAKEYLGQYKYEKIHAGKTNSTENKTTNCADFIAMIMNITDKEIAQSFTDINGYSNVTMIIAAIETLGGEIRKDNPKVGDIAIWQNGSKGHVELVGSVTNKDGKTTFTLIGAGSGIVPREMGVSKNGYSWLNSDYKDMGGLGDGGIFIGYWTPHEKI
ncbi:MAG TPA: CHAP domain-containing protein [Cytophagaceae bacterium]|jgi:hypothetical protein|nr:CHAP domain-containing protein [Cytophagaceae bacterium]